MNHKVLLVEDNEGDLFLIKEAFKDANFQGNISEVKDGQAAIDFLTNLKENNDEAPIDLILLDINLPKKNGHEVLHFIKKTNGLKQIPVVILTTSSSKIDIKLAYHNFANGYIIKPTDVDHFQEAIAQINNYWFTIVQLPG